MHWNILAAKLCNKDKLGDLFKFYFNKDEHLSWAFRSPLIKKHIISQKPDIVGLSELDCAKYESTGSLGNYNTIAKVAQAGILSFVEEKGYGAVVHERWDGNCAQAVLYDKKKLKLVFSEKCRFEAYPAKAPHFFIACVFESIKDSKKRFVWIQTHLKAMPFNTEARIMQVQKVLEYSNSKK